MTEYDEIQLEISNLSKRVDEKFADFGHGIEEILKSLNGPDGLVTKTELAKQSLSRVWWFIGSIMAGLFGLAFFVIKKSI